MKTELPLIAHVVHRFGVGGLENGIINLVNRMPRDAWRHAIVSLTDVSTELRQRVQRDDVQWVSIDKRPGHLAPYYPRLLRLFRRLRPSIVHTRNLAALEASIPAWMAGVTLRVHGEHGWDVHDLGGRSRKYLWVRRLYSPFVQKYVALSQDLETYLVDRVGIAQRKVVQIYNGVDTERYKPGEDGRMPIPGCPFVARDLWLVGTVGRMEPVKDQVNLAHAFARALRNAPDAARRLRLIVVGEGTLRSKVAEVLEHAGVAGLAWLPGQRSDIPAVLRGLDCFVLPSLAEGISNTILEAMACGLPVIATRVGGNAELIQPNVTGRLVPVADSDALASAIVATYLDPSAARGQGRAARRAAESKFALEGMVTRYNELYEAMLARHRSPTAGKKRSGSERRAAGS